MSNMFARRTRKHAVWLVALVGALLVAAPATAAAETFHRFEVDATANYIVDRGLS